MDKQPSEIVKRHISCPCGDSSDAYSIYSDGHGYCFSCSKYFPATSDDTLRSTEEKGEFIPVSITNNWNTALANKGEFIGIPDRNINIDTCRKYGVKCLSSEDKITKHIYHYVDKNNRHIANKIRVVDNKSFSTEGDINSALLFGQNLFNQAVKFITVVEGELDALAAYQMLGSKWPVVSVKSATTALRDCKKNISYLSQFDNVVLCFDNDKAGKKATDDVASLFPPGVAKIVTLEDYKDASDYLKNNKQKLFTDSWWNQKTYTPDGIVCFSEMWDILNTKDDIVSVPYPWKGLNDMTYGMRVGELCTYTAGSGQGKSSILREIVYDLLQSTEYKIGMMFLEETPKKTAMALCGLDMNKPIHLPDVECSEEELRTTFDKLANNNRLFLLDHFGSWGIDKILYNVRHLAKGNDCKFIFIDHISIIVSSQESGDERRALDEIMTKLTMLVKELDIHLGIITHLKRVSGNGHEEGSNISLSHLRGTAGIGQLSDMVIGVERNSQHDDLTIRNTSTVRVLKNRFSGDTGPCAYLFYDRDGTGRIYETNNPFEDDENEDTPVIDRGSDEDIFSSDFLRSS